MLRAFLRSRDDLQCIDPGDGTVAFPKLLGVVDTSEFAERLLAERRTAVVPGRFFEAPSHFRLGFSGATDALRGGLDALSCTLDERRGR